uniref:Protein kinase domain-containing protein n=1 Tax=Plectus sambesii TaxID=2011161 RepID=A0A914WE36_9BILA
MNEEYGEYSTDGGEKEEDYESDNETLSKDNDEYLSYDAPIPDRLEYEAIGEKLEIDPNTLTLIQVIGKGYFSDVHMGMLSLLTGKVPVAVKKPQMETGAMNAAESAAILKRQRQALKDELSIFAHLQSSSTGGHENVLKLLGAITTIKTDFCLLTEYCECGSMDRFLQAKWKNKAFENELVFEENGNEQVWKIQRDSKWEEDFRSRRKSGLITTSDLLWFALQIARGMQFLATMNVMHRDIAVRNVLLKLDFTLKVADFGLSRKLKEDDDTYYVGNKGTALPIRYIAPETLKSGRFSITTEYWSFGVVVWELFTFAEKQPYSMEFDIYENKMQFYEFLVEYLSSGHRLSIPNNMPRQIISLLSRLWLSDPKRRPSFEVCRKVIRQELMLSCPNILSNEKSLHHASERSLFRFDDEDINEGTLKTLDYTKIAFNTSVLPSSDIQQTENHKIRERKRVKRRIVISVGVLAVLLLAMLTALGYTLLYTSPLPWNNVTSNANSNITEVPLVLNNISAPILHKTINEYRKAAEQGDAESQYQLGLMYREGKGVLQSDGEAAKWFKKAAEQGNADAQFSLGRMYQNGRGVPQSDEETVKWFRKSAEQGDADAQAVLAVIYEYGLGVPQSDEEALKWRIKAAEHGNAEAQSSLGSMYKNGEGVPQSDEEAVKWYRKGAEQGNADAQEELAVMYQNGQGVLKSEEEALKWYRKSAEQGNTNAQYNVGLMYDEGRGVPPSDEEAIKWYHKAAEQGFRDAQRNLGGHYLSGRGNRGLQMCKIVLEVCIRKGGACLNQMQKLSNGLGNLQNKDIQMGSLTLDGCISMGEVYLNQMKKL